MKAFLTTDSFDSGSNDYGSWIKFPDGTLIQYGTLKINVTSDNTYSVSARVKYPIAASKICYVGLTNIFSYSDRTIYSIGTMKLDGFDVYAYKYEPYMTGHSVDAYWLSIGRWK